MDHSPLVMKKQGITNPCIFRNILLALFAGYKLYIDFSISTTNFLTILRSSLDDSCVRLFLIQFKDECSGWLDFFA